MKHVWEDISRHGSPHYECAACKAGHVVYRNNENAECPDAPAYHARAAKYKENQERSEYMRLLIEKTRWEYLHNKYGSEYVCKGDVVCRLPE